MLLLKHNSYLVRTEAMYHYRAITIYPTLIQKVRMYKLCLTTIIISITFVSYIHNKCQYCLYSQNFSRLSLCRCCLSRLSSYTEVNSKSMSEICMSIDNYTITIIVFLSKLVITFVCREKPLTTRQYSSHTAQLQILALLAASLCYP